MSAEQWPSLSLGKLLLVPPKNGYSPTEAPEPTGTVLLGLGCLGQDGFTPSQLKNAPANDPQLARAMLRDGDVLLSRSNTRNAVGYVGQYRDVGVPAAYPDLMMRLVPRENALSASYLVRALQSPAGRRQIEAAAVGTSGSMQKLNKAAVESLSLLVPPLPEQRQIAAVLDTIDDAIQRTEQIIAKLKQVKQGLLHDLLTRGIDDNGELRDPDHHPEQFKDSALGRIPRTWQVNRLESLTSRRIVDGVHHTPTYVQHGVPFLTVENLSRGPGISLEPCRYVSPSAHSEYYRRADPRAGDVLVSKDGTLGIARIIPNDFPEVSIFVSIALLRPRRDCVLPELICEFFETASYMRQLAYQSAGTGLKHIHLEHFRAFVLPVPPLEEQRRIFAILGAAESRLAAERAALSALRATKHGLMEDLLTGRVRVTPLLSDAP